MRWHLPEDHEMEKSRDLRIDNNTLDDFYSELVRLANELENYTILIRSSASFSYK